MSCRSSFVFLSYLIVLIVLNIGEAASYTQREILYQENSSEEQTATLVQGRILVENNNTSGTDLGDTVRVDPFDKLKKYRGGFDITEVHYWSSTAFTGIYGYAIGALWLLCGILYGGYLVTTMCIRKKKSKKMKKRTPCSRHCYLWPIIMATSFTFLAIIVSGVVIGGTTRFNSRVNTVLNIIIDTTEGAADTIYNVTGAMRDIRDNGVISDEGDDIFSFLNSTSESLDVEASELSRQARKNKRLIDRILKIVYITSTVIISLNLVAVIALSVCGFLKLRRALYMLVILCWLMAALCWVYFGLYFFLDKFTGDTCTAFKDFQHDPYNNSLSSILPCDELRSADSVLLDARVVISDLINEVNQNISVSFGSNLVQICNPFSAPPEYNYQPENCPANTVRIGDIPEVLQAFTCSNGENATCGEGQFISSNDFSTIESYSISIQNLLDAFPGMESLVDCQIVKDAFTEIISKHCKPVNKYVTMVWGSMIVLSTFMVVLVLIWTVKVFHDHGRHFADGSVKPHLASEDTLEVDKEIGSTHPTKLNVEP